MTILPEDDTVMDQRESCTIDEAVAKMLGWMRGFVRKSIVEPDQYGIFSQNDLSHLYQLPGSLKEMLEEQRDAARQKLFSKANDKDLYEHIQELDEDVNIYNELLDKCIAYELYIDDELAKGESSVLKIDKQTTEETGITHITLVSLDEWSQRKFGISIFNSLKREHSDISQSAENTSQTPENQPADTINATNNVNQDKEEKQRLRMQEQAILDEIKKLGLDPMKIAKPKHGKRVVRSRVYESLRNHKHFKAKTAFKHAWQRLLEFGLIGYEE